MEKIVGPEGFFATNDLETAMKLMKSSIKIVLITSGSGGLKLIPQVYEFEPIQNVNAAIIFCRDVQGHNNWSRNYPIVKGVFANFQAAIDAAKQ